MLEFNIVLENSRLKEDMGIEVLHFAKCMFNILEVDYYRESFDDEGTVEPYTVIILDKGIQITLDVPYDEFKDIYKKHNE
jgi:hypothetical protein